MKWDKVENILLSGFFFFACCAVFSIANPIFVLLVIFFMVVCVARSTLKFGDRAYSTIDC